MPAQIDYDLHGLVGIRLINASPSDAAGLARQLGPIQSPLTSEPDIVVRFVDRLAHCSRVRYLGLDDCGFTDDTFLVLRGKHKSRMKVQIPFGQIGKQCEIVCESGISAVPLLIPIINLTALSKGAIPLHASAFVYNGVGVLATGWSKGGKTETLLAFMARGAQYVGDEWVYISSDGQRMYGIPQPIRLWDWHLQDLPKYRVAVGSRDHLRLRILKRIIKAMELTPSIRIARRLLPVTAIRRITRLLKRQLFVDMAPEKLFGQRIGPMVSSPDKIFFVASHDAPNVTVSPMDPAEIARRMVFSLQEERMEFMSYYFKFRFAFPEARNEIVEKAEELERKMLSRAMVNKEAYAVYHPYPVVISSLFDAMSPFCSSSLRAGKCGQPSQTASELAGTTVGRTY